MFVFLMICLVLEVWDLLFLNMFLLDGGIERLGDDFFWESVEMGEVVWEDFGGRWFGDFDREVLGLWLVEGCLILEVVIIFELLWEWEVFLEDGLLVGLLSEVVEFCWLCG